MSNDTNDTPGDLSRRAMLGVLGAAATVPFLNLISDEAFAETPRPHVPDFDLDEATIDQLQSGMTAGKFTARELAEKYLARIGSLDRHGPSIRAVIELNPDALSIADSLDRERKEGRVRGPLHGIPMVVKDNLDTADRMMTTAGSLAMVGSKPLRDSFVVEKLRQAGVVLLGKTNLSEWANIRSTQSSSGWSARGGQSKNPYVLDRNTSGSSSGSASAVAANFCAAAIGTETDGSIVSPASVCGIVGIKPTVGRVSRSGIIPIAHSQDTAGPMTRTVADAVAVLNAISAADPKDNADGSRIAMIALPLDPRALKGARLGIVRSASFGLKSKNDVVLNEAVAALKSQGAVVIDAVEMPTLGQFDNEELEVLLYELKADLNAYLAGLGTTAPVKSLKELIDFNERNADREMPYFGQELFIEAQKKGPLTTKEYVEARRKCVELSRQKGIDAVMTQHALDALVAITSGPSWPIDLVSGDRYTGGSSTPAAVAGYPHVTVPSGFIQGLPVGLSFFGRAWSEERLVNLAHAYEQATKGRRKPKFLATLEG